MDKSSHEIVQTKSTAIRMQLAVLGKYGRNDDWYIAALRAIESAARKGADELERRKYQMKIHEST